MLDRVVYDKNDEDEKKMGIKAVTINEHYFTGHFSDLHIMPRVLQVEALTQLASILLIEREDTSIFSSYEMSAYQGPVFLLDSLGDVKWGEWVVPGDTLVMEVELSSISKKKKNKESNVEFKAKATAYVNGKMAVHIKEMTFERKEWINNVV